MIRTNDDVATLRRKIGGRLVEIRKFRALLQHELAQGIGISSRSYQNYELGIRAVPAEVIVRLAEVYGVNAHWLTTGEGHMIYTDPQKAAAEALRAIFEISDRLGVKVPEAKLPRLLVTMMESYISMNGPGMLESENMVKLAGEKKTD